jgi:hypothetical protein
MGEAVWGWGESGWAGEDWGWVGEVASERAVVAALGEGWEAEEAWVREDEAGWVWAEERMSAVPLRSPGCGEGENGSVRAGRWHRLRGARAKQAWRCKQRNHCAGEAPLLACNNTCEGTVSRFTRGRDRAGCTQHIAVVGTP